MIKQKDIIRNIDVHIIEKGLYSKSILEMNSELNTRIRILYSGLKDIKFDNIGDFINHDISNDSEHNKYIYYFITHTIKRLGDLKWMFDNKEKFKSYSDSQLFKLVKLKDKLKNETY